MNSSPEILAQPKTVAAIDVGSNAIRMVIGQIGADGGVTRLENLQRAVPLGRDSFAQGRIKNETMRTKGEADLPNADYFSSSSRERPSSSKAIRS